MIFLGNAYASCENIVERANQLGYNSAIEQLELLKKDMNQSPHYWGEYGRLLYKAKNYSNAVEKLNIASNLTSNPNPYLKIGNCYEKMSRYSEAAKAYSVAENIEPHLFAPRFASMRLFEAAKDTVHTVLKAREIIGMNPKVPSEKVDFYKREAKTNLLFLTLKN